MAKATADEVAAAIGEDTPSAPSDPGDSDFTSPLARRSKVRTGKKKRPQRCPKRRRTRLQPEFLLPSEVDEQSDDSPSLLSGTSGLKSEEMQLPDDSEDSSAFRSSRRERDRSGRNQIDHDVFEGLPVRQWRQVDAPVGPPPAPQPVKGRYHWPELSMPRDWHLLPEVSQQLLRAARAPRLAKPPTPPADDDDKDDEDADGAKETQKGFMARKWSALPRHMEEPDREYLAKRRKGLPSVYSTWGGLQGSLAQMGPMKKTKVRKVDADGNVNVWEVLVPEGQTVEGEIVDEIAGQGNVPPPKTVEPGTVVEGVGIANSEGVIVAAAETLSTPRRKNMPPRPKKKKGPGRGHKKKVDFVPGTDGTVGGQNGVANGLAPAAFGANGDGATPSAANTPMPDAQEGEEGEESGEEGEEDDDDREEGEMVETPNGSETPSRLAGSAPASAPTSVPPPATSAPDSDAVLESSSSLQAVTSHSTMPGLDSSRPGINIPPTEPGAEAAVVQAGGQTVSIPELAVTLEPALPGIQGSHGVAETRSIRRSREMSSSPDEPLAATSHSRQNSLTHVSAPNSATVSAPPSASLSREEVKFADGEVDLFSSLERHLEGPVSAAELQRSESNKPDEDME